LVQVHRSDSQSAALVAVQFGVLTMLPDSLPRHLPSSPRHTLRRWPKTGHEEFVRPPPRIDEMWWLGWAVIGPQILDDFPVAHEAFARFQEHVAYLVALPVMTA
jgi:hypothetical protein